MKKNQKILFCFVILLCAVAGIFIYQKVMNPYPITEPYEYSIVPGTDEWNELQSLEEKLEACQIPEEIVSKMTTEALVESVMNYPMIIRLSGGLWGGFESGREYAFNKVKSEFNGLQELCNRADAKDELVKYGERSDEKESELKTLLMFIDMEQ